MTTLRTVAINQLIFKRRREAYDAIPMEQPRVGDFIKHLNGKVTRVTHVWHDCLQAGGGDGSFYLGEGYISYSGGLDLPIPLKSVVLTIGKRKGWIWFFSEDHRAAHNGVDFEMDFRVFQEIKPEDYEN